MPSNDSLFETSGISINSLVEIISGSFNPKIIGQSAPIGSMFLQTNGDTWKKYGLSIFDWVLECSNIIAPLPTRTVTVTDNYLVEVDVKVVCANHYYDEGIIITLDASNYYSTPITIKNLSGNPIFIVSNFGRIEGKTGHSLTHKYESITLEPYGDSWIITSHVQGVQPKHQNSCQCHHNHQTHSCK
jgi:hypothetical protein